MSSKFLAVSSDAKTIKGEKSNYLTGILYLSPARLSGYEVCPNRTQDCTILCLNYSGRGRFGKIQEARINKTKLFFEDRPRFFAELTGSIDALIRKAKRQGMTPCVRLNGTSDIAWEAYRIGPHNKTIFELYPAIQFYDYTKTLKRIVKQHQKELPPNYHLTFSASGENNSQCLQAISTYKANVTMVFSSALPSAITFKAHPLTEKFPVINGDENDLRFLDPPGTIIGLKAKGVARGVTQSPFIFTSPTLSV